MLNLLINFSIFLSCSASYHEQYRVPQASTNSWESYTFNDKDYLIQNLPLSWENAGIMCKGYHNASLAVIDTVDKAEFLAEALSESQFSVSSLWVGARRDSAEDPQGYRWGPGLELRRTALDVLDSESDQHFDRRFPMWLNRTHIPVPETGADCVALERFNHDVPLFLDLPCNLERPFVCEKEVSSTSSVHHIKTVRCRNGVYHLFDGKLTWHQAAAYCVLRRMNLANIATVKCLRKLGMTMLKSRPSIERAWIGASGHKGRWSWLDTGDSIFNIPRLSDASPNTWPPVRDRTNIKQDGCLQLDRHETHAPVFLEARCDRMMQFICYENKDVNSRRVMDYSYDYTHHVYVRNNISLSALSSTAPPSDDQYFYILVKQKLYWQHAYENCAKMNGTLASLDNNEILIQLLLVMGENKDKPVEHIWVSGRLNTSRDLTTDKMTYIWYNPINQKRIPDPKISRQMPHGSDVLPWLDEEFSLDSPCLNLDRQDHLVGLVYGLPCDTSQYSVCMIEKSLKPFTPDVSITTPISEAATI